MKPFLKTSFAFISGTMDHIFSPNGRPDKESVRDICRNESHCQHQYHSYGGEPSAEQETQFSESHAVTESLEPQSDRCETETEQDILHDDLQGHIESRPQTEKHCDTIVIEKKVYEGGYENNGKYHLKEKGKHLLGPVDDMEQYGGA